MSNTQEKKILSQFLTNIKFLMNSSNDDGFEALEGIINFMKKESLFHEIINKLEETEYSEEILYKGRDYNKYKLPSNSDQRNSFIWSLINDWVTNHKNEEYFNLGDLYGGKTTKIDDHVINFHDLVLRPFFEGIYTDLDLEISKTGKQETNINISNTSGPVTVQSNTTSSTINVASDINSNILELIKEINLSNYKEKNKLISLLKILSENSEERLKDKGFLELLMDKWNPYLSLIESSQHAISFGKLIAPFLTHL
ncbi:hypothetical protein LEP1GSC202_3520 [Leptospira yanagawae serovar Saopaulo str. Sao Paulo = ATCC 700523]|uniref:Uncharacterized protein n=1 Tax=Leptospira yanagawae serovar Saopaulo str. Sao Paulo = ATCC 700523 TaxID=1249483 RepID=A0A5E8H9J6_9LEPT|nr:hypothetical protein [Leptospira yanagawae]EOQ87388.1 hypothetical protein LEP1GSC202_3520 [Leptospira yanagawae serovar Saopaulo str. Sao Paulo = ATCC 700523]